MKIHNNTNNQTHDDKSNDISKAYKAFYIE